LGWNVAVESPTQPQPNPRYNSRTWWWRQCRRERWRQSGRRSGPRSDQRWKPPLAPMVALTLCRCCRWRWWCRCAGAGGADGAAPRDGAIRQSYPVAPPLPLPPSAAAGSAGGAIGWCHYGVSKAATLVPAATVLFRCRRPLCWCSQSSCLCLQILWCLLWWYRQGTQHLQHDQNSSPHH
jgi:hypothetical protein